MSLKTIQILSFVLSLLAATIPASGAEEDLFYIPQDDDARFQKISKVGNEQGWPFTVDKGLLACIYAAGRPLVMFFVEDGFEKDNVTPKLRTVTISTDPFEAIFGNMAVNDLIADEGGNSEVRLSLFASFYETGSRLCDQPQGSFVGSGEL